VEITSRIRPPKLLPLLINADARPRCQTAKTRSKKTFVN
jgi:hypothetical protein